MQNIATVYTSATAIVDIITNILNTMRDQKRKQKVDKVLTVMEIASIVVNQALPTLEKVVSFVIDMIGKMYVKISDICKKTQRAD